MPWICGGKPIYHPWDGPFKWIINCFSHQQGEITFIHHTFLNNYVLTSVPEMQLLLCCLQDDQTGNWLVYVNGMVVGYFPRGIVNGMDGSTQVQVGGIVYAPPGSKRPPMGNGIAPRPDSNNGAAKFKWVEMRGCMKVKFRETKDVENSNIYDVMVTSASENGPEGFSFQYGGPGGA